MAFPKQIHFTVYYFDVSLWIDLHLSVKLTLLFSPDAGRSDVLPIVMDEKYFAKKIEAKWQAKWAESGAFEAEISDEKPKFFQLEMLPYPSGNLHMGHVRNYAVGDAVAWYKRLKGFNVLHPIGWDSFGQPAEDAAVKRGVNPRQWTEDNINVMRGQLERLGLSYDWRRQMYAHRKEYYKFDQWFFIKMYEMGLAYKKMTQVNWCENDKATLSNEQASGGICWRCGEPVTKKDLEQWFFRTTAYADQLIDDMEKIESGWPAHVIKRQRDWIGRSEGAFVEFQISGKSTVETGAGGNDAIAKVRVFTTRIDTIYGATAIVVAAEHPVIAQNAAGFSPEVIAKIDEIKAEKLKPADHEAEIEKDGIDTGLKAINPFNGEELPVWVGNYVMMEYGTGAVMSVPAHDERDFEFAKKFGMPVKTVISAESEIRMLKTAYSEEVELFDSPKLSEREKDIHEKTFAYLQENVEELIAKYYEIHGRQIINADRSKELFDDYNQNRLENDRAIQPSASALTRLILKRRLSELPEGSTIVLTAGGQASGKSTAIRENMDADLIYDSVMANAEGNRKVLDMIAEHGHFARIIYVHRPIENAVVAMMRRQAVEGRPVSEENMASGHFGSQRSFIEDTDEYARSLGFTIRYIQTIENGAPQKITLNELIEKAYISREEVLKKVIYGINNEYKRHEYGRSVRDVLADSTKENDPGGIRGLVRGDRRSSDPEYVVSSSAARTSASHNSPEIAFTDHGFLINSGRWSGKTSDDAKREMAEYAQANGFGEAATTFRLRDWGVSRQRYWGAPIPMIYCSECGTVPVKFEDLPVELPDNAPITGTGESPLAKVPEFYETTCPSCEGPARRETDTMDTFVDSSWYFFRYTDNQNEVLPFDPDTAAYWTPVDQYIGGDDHAVMHLIYTRFWTKVMRDIGLVKFDEPAKRLLTQGMVVGETFYDDTAGKKIYHAPDTVTVERDEKGRITSVKAADGAELKFAVERMSKSKGNGVDPDEMVDVYGADAARLFVLFAAPVDNELVWHEAGIEGAVRFLQRVWRFVHKWKDAMANGSVADDVSTPSPAAKKLRQKTHQTIKRIDQSLDTLQFNTPVAALMELANDLYDMKAEPETASPDEIAAVREALTSLILMLTPFAPHISEEMFAAVIGNEDGILANDARFPVYDEDAAKADEIEIAVQVNGKLRSRIFASPDADNAELERMAKEDAKVREYTDGKDVAKVIVVPGRLVNIVVKG